MEKKIPVMKRLFNSSTAFLWLLIIATLVLLGGQAAGVEWGISERMAFGRLLVHPGVAGIEVFLAATLIGLLVSDYPFQKWISDSVAVIAIICGMYHLIYYSIGMEFLLLYGSGLVLHKKSPGQN